MGVGIAHKRFSNAKGQNEVELEEASAGVDGCQHI